MDSERQQTEDMSFGERVGEHVLVVRVWKEWYRSPCVDKTQIYSGKGWIYNTCSSSKIKWWWQRQQGCWYALIFNSCLIWSFSCSASELTLFLAAHYSVSGALWKGAYYVAPSPRRIWSFQLKRYVQKLKTQTTQLTESFRATKTNSSHTNKCKTKILF